MILVGHIVKELDEGAMIHVPYPPNQRSPADCHETVAVEFVDKRRISAKQRKKAYVLISYIAAWWGYTPLECMKEMLKLMFIGEAETLRRTFSLSDCDMTTARLFITYLIDFCILHGVDVGEPLYQLSEDIPRYVWACLMNKRCAVCGRKAEASRRCGGYGTQPQGDMSHRDASASPVQGTPYGDTQGRARGFPQEVFPRAGQD